MLNLDFVDEMIKAIDVFRNYIEDDLSATEMSYVIEKLKQCGATDKIIKEVLYMDYLIENE